jgi:hypothetical protein
MVREENAVGPTSITLLEVLVKKVLAPGWTVSTMSCISGTGLAQFDLVRDLHMYALSLNVTSRSW